MDDTSLSAEDEQQLRDALAQAPDDVKDGFCRCWPAMKKLLDWLGGRLPDGRVKKAVKFVADMGEAIYDLLDCAAKPEPA